jgi:hypothetical protein
METVEVTLPGGVVYDGRWHRTARLRPLSGRHEVFVAEAGRSLRPAARTTALLTRCLDALGPLEPVTSASVSALTVGDREALLLHLRRLTLGDRISCVLSCPDRSCSERMDLDLRVSDLLLPPYAHAESVHETVLGGDGCRYRVRFRLPTGADQEAAADLAFRDPEAAAAVVLERCVGHVTVDGDDEEAVEALPPAVARALPGLMAELDPQAEILLSLLCPACGTSFTVPFDAADYFHRELSGQRTDVYREAHLLALHYHWSEAEIMAMPRQTRRLYLGLLAEALGAERAR